MSNIHTANDIGWSEFKRALAENDLVSIKHTFRNINRCDAQGRNLFYMAVANKHLQAIRVLSNMGINVNKRDDEGKSPLDVAFYAVVRLNGGYEYRLDKFEPLTIEVFEAVLEAGASTGTQDDAGRTIFHKVVLRGKHVMIPLLTGAPGFKQPHLNVIDNHGNTALHYAMARETRTSDVSHLESIALLDAGADFQVRNKKGQTPLESIRDPESLSSGPHPYTEYLLTALHAKAALHQLADQCSPKRRMSL